MLLWLPCLSDDWGVEQGLTEGEALMGDTPATRLRGGPGEEEGEGLDMELRHLETEEGVGLERGVKKRWGRGDIPSFVKMNISELN